MGERCYACGHRLRKAKSRFREDLGPAKVYAVLVGRDAPRICYTFEEVRTPNIYTVTSLLMRHSFMIVCVVRVPFSLVMSSLMRFYPRCQAFLVHQGKRLDL